MSAYRVSFLLKLALLAIAAATDEEILVPRYRIQTGKSLGRNHKHVVQIKSQFYPSEQNNSTFSCTGSILNERWIITARHCLYKDTQVLLGAQVIRHMHLHMSQPIAAIAFRFPQLNPQRTFSQNDIGLMKLATPIPLNDGVHQAIALDRNYPIEGVTAVVAGYGKPDPSEPRQGLVRLVYCPEGPLCSFSSGPMARPDHGDSGGPLMINGKLAGTISEGTNSTPVYEEHYSAIADHYPWIINTIKT